MAKIVQTKAAVEALNIIRENLKLLSNIKRSIAGADTNRENIRVSLTFVSDGKLNKISMTKKYAGKMIAAVTDMGRTVSKETITLADKYNIELTDEEMNLLID